MHPGNARSCASCWLGSVRWGWPGLGPTQGLFGLFVLDDPQVGAPEVPNGVACPLLEAGTRALGCHLGKDVGHIEGLGAIRRAVGQGAAHEVLHSIEPRTIRQGLPIDGQHRCDDRVVVGFALPWDVAQGLSAEHRMNDDTKTVGV